MDGLNFMYFDEEPRCSSNERASYERARGLSWTDKDAPHLILILIAKGEAYLSAIPPPWSRVVPYPNSLVELSDRAERIRLAVQLVLHSFPSAILPL